MTKISQEIVFLGSVERHHHKSKLKDMITKSMQFFPELTQVYVGVLKENNYAQASAMPENYLVSFQIDRKPSYTVIFHELMHLVQHKCNMSKTEESCSVYAMARMPVYLVDASIPYIGGDAHYSKLPRICRDAIKYKEDGNRDYLKYVLKRVYIGKSTK